MLCKRGWIDFAIFSEAVSFREGNSVQGLGFYCLSAMRMRVIL